MRFHLKVGISVGSTNFCILTAIAYQMIVLIVTPITYYQTIWRTIECKIKQYGGLHALMLDPKHTYCWQNQNQNFLILVCGVIKWMDNGYYELRKQFRIHKRHCYMEM